MATHYSEHMAAASTAAIAVATSLADPTTRVPRGKSHSPLRYKAAHMNFTASTIAVNEEIRFFSLKSSDRVRQVLLSSTGSGTTAAMALGLFTSTDAHDGAVIDVDLFVAATDLTGAPGELDLFDLAALDDEDRGKQLWELLAIGAGDDTSDPAVTYEIVGTVGATVTSFTEGELTLEVVYTSE